MVYIKQYKVNFNNYLVMLIQDNFKQTADFLFGIIVNKNFLLFL